MKKQIILLLFALIFLINGSVAIKFSDPIIDEATRLTYRKNQFGDLFPSIEDLKEPEISEKLKSFVEAQKDLNPHKAFVIHLSLEKFSLVPSIVKAGFTHHFTDNTHTEWIIRNNSAVPLPLTTIEGALVVFFNHYNNTVLLVEDITRPNQWGFPGGLVDPEEFPIAAAAREAQEEVALTVNEKDLLLIADFQSINSNRYGANATCKVYLAKKYEGEVKCQESELKQAQWVPLPIVLQNGEFDGLKVDEYNKKILMHVFNNMKTSARVAVPDPRQFYESEKDKDPNDIMYLELIAQYLGSS